MQRKVFRIEQSGGLRRAAASESSAGNELASIRNRLNDNMRALFTLLHEGKEKRMTRAAGELGAAVEAMEKATDTILQAAEAIGECAKALAAAQKNDHQAGLTQNIQDEVLRIYEACNFQDIAGQRIGKVIGTLNLVEDGVANLIACTTGLGPATPCDLLNGPRLDGDSGHIQQRDIDALFS